MKRRPPRCFAKGAGRDTGSRFRDRNGDVGIAVEGKRRNEAGL